MRRGVSAIEVVLALIVIAVSLLPVIGVSQSQERESHFLEFELMAHRRCRALLDFALTQDLVALERARAAVFKLGPDGMAEATVALPAGFEGLGRIEHVDASGDVERPTPPGGRLALITDELALGRAKMGADDACQLYRVRARVTWQFPGDPAGAAPHVTELTRLAARPGLTHRVLAEVR